MRDADKRKEYKRQWTARQRAERKAAGLCPLCGAPVTPVNREARQPVNRGRGRPRQGIYCGECLAKRQENQKVAKAKAEREHMEDIARRLDELAARLPR